jgi:hypothetical protein
MRHTLAAVRLLFALQEPGLKADAFEDIVE